MGSDDIQEQRINGAKGIISSANILAIDAGIEINDSIWNKRQGIDNRELHTLELVRDGKTVSGEFDVEELEDYPGKVGTEKTDSKLRTMIRELSK